MGDPLTSLEGGAGVGSGLGKVINRPRPQLLLSEVRRRLGARWWRTLPGGGGGGSERAPGLSAEASERLTEKIPLGGRRAEGLSRRQAAAGEDRLGRLHCLS